MYEQIQHSGVSIRDGSPGRGSGRYALGSGKRPYQRKGGRYIKEDKKEVYERRKHDQMYNKKHFDQTISTSETLSTLSYDPNRTKNVDMFYAAYKNKDKHLYNMMFNEPINREVYDQNGNSLGSARCYKMKINNQLKQDIKVASEDSGAEIFSKMFQNDGDFYKFVTDSNRMRSYFVESKYKFKGYREVRDVLEKMDKKDYVPSEKDVKTLYRMFNYVIPYDGGGSDAKGKKDVERQRAKFFEKAKENGYGALLDTNDSIYGGYKTDASVIVFDVDKVIPKSVYNINMDDKVASTMITLGNRILGIDYDYDFEKGS